MVELAIILEGKGGFNMMHAGTPARCQGCGLHSRGCFRSCQLLQHHLAAEPHQRYCFLLLDGFLDCFTTMTTSVQLKIANLSGGVESVAKSANYGLIVEYMDRAQGPTVWTFLLKTFV